MSQDSRPDYERENRPPTTDRRSTNREEGDRWDNRRSVESVAINERFESPTRDYEGSGPFLAGRVFTDPDGMSDSEVPWDGTLEESDILPPRTRDAGRGSIHADFVKSRDSSGDVPASQKERSNSNERSKRKTNGVCGGCRPHNGHHDGPDDSDDEEDNVSKPVEQFSKLSIGSYKGPQVSTEIVLVV